MTTPITYTHPIVRRNSERNRSIIVQATTFGGAWVVLYKWLEQVFTIPNISIYQSTWFWCTVGFFGLFIAIAKYPKRSMLIGCLALVVSFLTHISGYILGFTQALGMHDLPQDSIISISRWNTLNYMVTFSLLPLRRAFMVAGCFFIIPTVIWTYFTHIYSSYEALGLTQFDFSTFLLTSLINLVFCGVLKYLTSLRAQDNTWAALANTDTLTGLANRLYLEYFLQTVFPKRQEATLKTAVALCDIDNFKKINDAYSHTVGDEVLKHFARVLQDTMRPDDIVGRYGGEEFLLIFLDIPTSEAIALCEKLRVAIEAYDWTRVHPDLSLTASFGISDNTEISDEDNSAKMIHQADIKMYRAKHNGKNQVCA